MHYARCHDLLLLFHSQKVLILMNSIISTISILDTLNYANNVCDTKGPVHMGSQVSSPTNVSKYQHGGRVPTFEPQETIEIWLIIIEIGSQLLNANILAGLVSRVESRCFA